MNKSEEKYKELIDILLKDIVETINFIKKS